MRLLRSIGGQGLLQLLLCHAPLSSAALHHLFAGTLNGGNSLYALEFDDQSLSLKLTKTISAVGSHSWICFSHDKKNLYGVSGSKFASYSITGPSSLRYDTSVALCSSCTERNIYVVAAMAPPYNVYGSTFGSGNGYGASVAVSANGTLSSMAQLMKYGSGTGAGVHGQAISADNRFLYSADDTGNTLWTHEILSNGTLSLVGKVAGPASKSDPRHVAVHPAGQYIYVVLEGTNQVAQYSVEQKTGVPTLVKPIYPLLPDGSSNDRFWADEVAVSPSGKYLWATTRARAAGTKGYISAFSLTATGAISKQLFLVPTTASGGSANAVTPAFFSDEWLSLTDMETKSVEIWRFSNETQTVKAVAHLDINGSGCCANAIWYD